MTATPCRSARSTSRRSAGSSPRRRVLGRALGGLLGREEGSLPQLQRPLLPASSEQGLRQGDGEAAEGGLHPRGHQDEDQGGRVVVKWIFHISITIRMLYFNV